jgi:hypothetical protein
MGRPYLNRRQLTTPDFTFIHYQPAQYDGRTLDAERFGKFEVYKFDFSTCIEMFVGYAEGELFDRLSSIFRAAALGAETVAELRTTANRLDSNRHVFPLPLSA